MHVFRAKTAAQSQAETTRMARRLFVSPPPRRIILPILAFSVMEGFLLNYPRLDATAVAKGAAAIALPAYVAAVATTSLAEVLGGRMYLRRSTLLAFVGLIALGTMQLVAVVLLTIYALAATVAFAFDLARVTVLGYGAMLWVREVILESTSNSRHLRSLPAAALQPVLGLAGLALVVPMSPWDVFLSLLAFAVFFVSAVGFTEIAKRPLLRSFGFDGLRLLRHTLDHYTELEDAGVAELESFFETISVPARVRVAGVAFRASGLLGAVFLAPTVHPGPMGYVSGSDLPTKIARDLADLTPNVLVAHGPTTHDENPATTAEIRKIAEAVRRLLSTVPFLAEAGRAVRAARGKASAMAQAFGDTVLIVASFAPNPTDDIDGATGHAAVQEAKLAGAGDAIFVDAHNCLEPGVGLTHFGSQESHEMILAARAAVEAALKAPKGRMRVGYARRAGFCTPDQGFGARGIETLVVQVGDQKTAYVLFDGNNVVPGLRDEVRARIAQVVQESEVLTTDNHSVNLTMTGFNAVGAALDRAVILDQADQAVRDAVANLQPGEAAPFVEDVANFRIFGPQSASRLTTSINSTMAVLRPALYVTLSGAIAAAALVLVLL